MKANIQKIDKDSYRIKGAGRTLIVSQAECMGLWRVIYAAEPVIAVPDLRGALHVAEVLSFSTCELLKDYEQLGHETLRDWADEQEALALENQRIAQAQLVSIPTIFDVGARKQPLYRYTREKSHQLAHQVTGFSVSV